MEEIFNAIEYDDVEKLRNIFEHPTFDTKNIEIRNEYMETPLIEASKKESAQCIRLLI